MTDRELKVGDRVRFAKNSSAKRTGVIFRLMGSGNAATASIMTDDNHVFVRYLDRIELVRARDESVYRNAEDLT